MDIKAKIIRLNKILQSKLKAIRSGSKSASNTHVFSDSDAFDIVNSKWYQDNLYKYDSTIDLLKSVIKNLVYNDHIHAVMLYGSAGVGKTWNTIETLDRLKSRDGHINYYQIKGKITPVELYSFVCQHSGPNDIVIFDDCDTAFTNNDSMNLIKAMTDTYDHRMVTYNSPYISRQGLPTEFEFFGKLIMITNQSILGNEHYNALRDRMLLFTLDLDWESKFCKSIDMIVNSIKYRRSSNYRKMAQYVVDYMYKRQAVFNIPEYSLRTAIRLMNVYELVGEDRFDKFVHQMKEFNWDKE
jgi:hypothetical protein